MCFENHIGSEWNNLGRMTGKPEVIRHDKNGLREKLKADINGALIRTPALGVVSPCNAQRLFDRLPAPIPNEACSLERCGPASQERDARRTTGRAKRPPACGEPSSSAQLSSAGTQFLRPASARFAPPQSYRHTPRVAHL